jgi:sterol desaturase/sphingolipid hydroxylase (fatty acid hydroxylase superfamily)
MAHDPTSVFEARDLSEFHREFVKLAEIRLYAGLAAACAVVAIWRASRPWDVVLPAVGVLIAFPILEYLIHRYVLHNISLCRSALTAPIWWRIHYRHHSEPSDAGVILGAPWSLTSAVLIAAAMIAVPFQSLAAFASAAATGLVCAIVYEYFHSLHHAQVEITSPYLLRMRRHHLLHHHLEEKGNFGITSPLIDLLCGTRYEREATTRSPTVRNLGYTDELREQYPWIAQMEQPAEVRAQGNEPAR